MTGGLLGIFLGASLALFTAWSLGRLLLRGLRLKLRRLEEDLFALLAGSACLSVIVFVLCSVHLARKGVFTMVCVASAGAMFWRRAYKPAPERLPRIPLLWLLLFLAPFTVYSILYFFNALSPDILPDGSAHHMGNVVRWWRDFGFVPRPAGIQADLPQGLEMLFLFAFSFGRHSAATLVHFAFLAALPCLLLCYGRRFGMTPAFVLGGILVYSSPVAGVAGTSAFNDLALAGTLFGLFYILQIWDQDGDARLLWVAGLLAGFGLTLRYWAVLGVAYGILFVCWRLRREPSSAGRAVTIFVVCAAVLMTPWMVNSWLSVGNPVPPFLNSWFPNPASHLWAAQPAIEISRQLPMLWSISGAREESMFGPWLLLTPLALLAARWKHGRRLLFAAALFAFAPLADTAARVLLPFAVFAAPALSLAVARSPGVLPALLLLHSLVSWPDAVAAFADPRALRLTGIPVAAALRSIPEDRYLQSKIDGYAVVRAIEELRPASVRVLTLARVPQAYTTRRLWSHADSVEGDLAFQDLTAASQPNLRPTREIRFRFPEQPVRALRVVAASSQDEPWSVTEMRLYRAGAEVPRRSAWRVAARPNLWDAPRAFDNSEVTAWSTWRAVEGGMYLEEQFDDAIALDAAALLCAPSDCGPRLRLEGRAIDGHWRTLADRTEVVERLPPQGLRRAAIREIKAQGFEYVVAPPNDGPGFDMHVNTSYWGITCLRETGGLCLYHLD